MLCPSRRPAGKQCRSGPWCGSANLLFHRCRRCVLMQGYYCRLFIIILSHQSNRKRNVSIILACDRIDLACFLNKKHAVTRLE
jgi:hypothetical protein